MIGSGGWEQCIPAERCSSAVVCTGSHGGMRQCVRWRDEEVGPVGLGKGQGGEAVGGGGFRVRALVLLAGGLLV